MVTRERVPIKAMGARFVHDVYGDDENFTCVSELGQTLCTCGYFALEWEDGERCP